MPCCVIDVTRNDSYGGGSGSALLPLLHLSTEVPHAPITVSTQTLDDTVQFLETATFQWMSR